MPSPSDELCAGVSATTTRLAAMALLCALNACASNLIVADQVPTLPPGTGIAAVVLDTADPISQVLLVPAAGQGGKLSIPTAAAGRTLYLLVAPAGRYCMHQFHFDALVFAARSDTSCFDVQAGAISYSGDFAPRVVDGTVVIEQNDNYQAFMQLLQAGYPKLAAKIPVVPR